METKYIMLIAILAFIIYTNQRPGYRKEPYHKKPIQGYKCPYCG